MAFETRPLKVKPAAEFNFDDLGFNFVPTGVMWVSRYAGGAWTDEGLVPEGEFWIHPAATVIHYGQALFEGMKARLTRQGEVVLFRPRNNAARMAGGCERLMMPPYPPDKFVAAVEQTVLANKAFIPPTDKGALYVRPFAFGSGPVMGVRPAEEYTFMVFVSPVGPYFKGGFHPIKLLASPDYHRAVAEGVGWVKAAGNYAGGLYPSSLAKKEGYAECLWLDQGHGHFEEVGAANFFVRKGDEVATPMLDDRSILAGITRASVLQLARDAGLKAVERDVLVDELTKVDEAWCTGTAAVITPIGVVNVGGADVTVGDGKVCKYTQLFFDELNAIQLKEVPDKYGWVVTLGKR